MKTKLCLFLSVFAIVSSGCDAQENGPKIELPNSIDYTYVIVADSIDIPWGLTFLNEKELLVTDKAGVLYHVENGIKTEVDGLPQVYVRGQGGLLDITVSPDYATTGTIYFTTSSPLGEEKGGHTALYSTQLENNTLVNTKLLYKGDYNTKKGQHWGSRISFDDAGHLYFSIGDRGNREVNPQDITRDGGKIYRLNLDGSIPADNPFVHLANSRAAIYSYGHRNPQGMVTHPETGEIWTHEHGPRGEMRLTSSKREKTMDGQLLPMELTIAVHQLQILPKKKGLNSPYTIGCHQLHPQVWHL